MSRYIIRNGKELRCGYTTGSCAAAAAGAAAEMLLTGKAAESFSIVTPSGETLQLPVEDAVTGPESASCGIRKDGGDDIDATNGLLICAHVTFCDDAPPEEPIRLTAGRGVGRVTKPGLDQPVGEAAINSVPRRMIRQTVDGVRKKYGCPRGLAVEISVPGGEEAAEKTFNPRLGITGGISILGTTGIVEPMSERAILDTIRVELRQRQALGREDLLLVPGNYGLDYLKQHGIPAGEAVKCSNFIGDSLDMAEEMHFRSVLLVGHIGKLVKLGAGVMNTHSRTADARMETLAACGLEAGIDGGLLRPVLRCNTTEEAVAYLAENGLLEAVCARLSSRIEKHMDARVHGRLDTAAVYFSSVRGLLGQTAKAAQLLARLRADN